MSGAPRVRIAIDELAHLPTLHLLHVDPDETIVMIAARSLEAIEQVEVSSVSSLRAALGALRHTRFSCVVTELVLPDAEGVAVLRELRAACPSTPIIVLTSAGSERLAVAAMKLGAADYLAKDSNVSEALPDVVRGALGRAVLAGLFDQTATVEAPPVTRLGGQDFIAAADGMRRVLALVDQATGSSVPVLLEGETGTGKEVLAHAIHVRGNRRDSPFLVQNCAALSQTLLESELFGHVRGSFTGAERDRRGLFVEAGDGTVFLDEIGETPVAVQAKLLRVFQHREVKPVGADRIQPVRARIIAATNRRLLDEVHAGRFRADLYYRLAAFPIRVPPLRHRVGDIPALLTHYLTRFRQEERRSIAGFSADTLKMLCAYTWPGNVRELEHEVRRLVLTVGDRERVRPEHLSRAIREHVRHATREPLSVILARVELALIRERLDRLPSKAAAARSLGITREGLYGKLRRLGVRV